MIDLKFDRDGLIPVVAQDANTGQVLMVAYMNRDALHRTLQTGNAWYWSRSWNALWQKGESSGHVQRVRALRADCDADTLLLQVEPQGPACHTGRQSCFFRDLSGDELPVIEGKSGDVLDELFTVLKQRRDALPEASYTASLLRSGRAQIAAKVMEEAEELTRAARQESDQRAVEEATDLLYHTWVLLVERCIELADVRAELERRRNG